MEQQANKKLWFRRKRYGWGWFPVTWEGWLTLLVYVVLMIYIVITADSMQTAHSDIFLSFTLPIIISTALLISICYWKGESPKWSWGKDEHTV